MLTHEVLIWKWMAKLAWRNVTRNWRHGLATLLAIATGFMAISTFDGFIRELVEKTNDGFTNKAMLGHVIIQREGASTHLQEDPWSYSLSAEEQRFLEGYFKTDESFLRRVRFLSSVGMINSGANSAIFMGLGFDLEEGAAVRGERWAWDTIAGKPLHMTAANGVLLGTKLGELLACETKTPADYRLPDGNFVPEDRPYTCSDYRVMLSATTESAQINAVSLKVNGLFDAGFREANSRAVYMSLGDAQRLLDTDKLTLIGVQLKDEADMAPFIERLSSATKAQNFKLEIHPWIEHPIANYARGGLEILGVFRNLFMGIVIIISVMAIASTMMKTVSERIPEIGTLRSFGFLRHHIAVMFAWEGFFISLLACAFGLLLTVVLAKVVGAFGITYNAGVLSLPMQLKVAYAPSAWAWSAGLLSLLATCTAWLCARRASRMVVAQAIHHV